MTHSTFIMTSVHRSAAGPLFDVVSGETWIRMESATLCFHICPHFTRLTTCSFVFKEKSRLPTSKEMERARLETFTVGDGWIHDKVRGHGASSKRVCLPQMIPGHYY